MRPFSWIAGAALLAGAALANATTYTVTNTGDNGGTNPAVGAGTGTLRQAIVDSNAAGGTNTIGFQIPGTGPQTITLASRLPPITSSVTIDGTSQAGWQANTNTPDQGGLNTKLTIEINGTTSSTQSADWGFFLSGSPVVTIQGMSIYGVSGDAIDGDGNTAGGVVNVYGCFLGTRADGTTPPDFYLLFGNRGVGVRTGRGNAQIGGTSPAQRNLISGNYGGGIYVGYAAVVEGNLVGTDITGAVANENHGWPGIIVPGNTPGVRVGCTGASCTQAGHPSRNVISGNYAYGIGIWDVFANGAPETGGLQIKGNYIGSDWTGTKPLPNGDATAGCPTYCGGFQIQNGNMAPASVIGGFNPGEANLIAFNNGPGIVTAQNTVQESFDNQGNSIHNNHNTDIAFNLQGWVANDPGDADTGANNMQNYPAIQSASVSGGMLTVTYLVDSTTTNSTYPLRIDFYVDIDAGSGEYLVSDSYPASSAQTARTVSLPLPADEQSPAGIVVTATDANGYTSEISPSWVFDRIFADRFDGH